MPDGLFPPVRPDPRLVDALLARLNGSLPAPVPSGGETGARGRIVDCWRTVGGGDVDAVWREMMRRDPLWLASGTVPDVVCEEAARPLPKEAACARVLASHGLRVLFRATRAGEHRRTSDVFLTGMGGVREAWEMKQPTGGGRQTIYHQFQEAARQSDRLILDATALDPDGRWGVRAALLGECERLLRYHFPTDGGVRTFREVLVTGRAGTPLTRLTGADGGDKDAGNVRPDAAGE